METKGQARTSPDVGSIEDVEKELTTEEGIEGCVDAILGNIGFGRFHALVFVPTIIATGADVSEMSCAGILLPALGHVYDLNKTDMSTYSMISIAGFVAGAFFFGPFGDRLGRKPLIILTSFGTFLFGALSAVSSSFKMLLAFRFVLGIFLAGNVPVMIPLVCEWVSSRHSRHSIILLLAGGTIIQCLLVFLLGRLLLAGTDPQWRLFLFIQAAPSLIATIFTITLPESPRLLFRAGRIKECAAVLEKAARINKVEIPPHLLARLLNSSSTHELSECKDQRKTCRSLLSSYSMLFHRDQWKTTMLLLVLFSTLFVVLKMFNGMRTLMLIDKFHDKVWAYNANMYTGFINLPVYLVILWPMKWFPQTAIMAVSGLGMMVSFILIWQCHSKTGTFFGLAMAILSESVLTISLCFYSTVCCFETTSRATGVGMLKGTGKLAGMAGSFFGVYLYKSIGIRTFIVEVAFMSILVLCCMALYLTHERGRL